MSLSFTVTDGEDTSGVSADLALTLANGDAVVVHTRTATALVGISDDQQGSWAGAEVGLYSRNNGDHHLNGSAKTGYTAATVTVTATQTSSGSFRWGLHNVRSSTAATIELPATPGAGATGSSDSPASGNVSQTATEALFTGAVSTDNNRTITEDGTFTDTFDGGPKCHCGTRSTTDATDQYAPSLSSSDGWCCGIVVLQEAAAGDTITVGSPLSAAASLPVPTPTPGAVSITATVLSAVTSLPQSAVSPGGVSINVGELVIAAAMQAGALTPGGVSLTAPVLVAVSSLPSPSVSTGAQTATIADPLSVTVVLPGASLTPGAVEITAPVLSVVGSLPAPSAQPGTVTLQPGELTVIASLPAGALTPGAVTITGSVLSITTSMPRPAMGGIDQTWVLGNVSIVPSVQAAASVVPSLRGEMSVKPTVQADTELDEDEG